MAEFVWQELTDSVEKFCKAVHQFSSKSNRKDAEVTCMLSRRTMNILWLKWLVVRKHPDKITLKLAKSLREFCKKLEEFQKPDLIISKYIDSVSRRRRVLAAIVENDINKAREIFEAEKVYIAKT